MKHIYNDVIDKSTCFLCEIDFKEGEVLIMNNCDTNICDKHHQILLKNSIHNKKESND